MDIITWCCLMLEGKISPAQNMKPLAVDQHRTVLQILFECN